MAFSEEQRAAVRTRGHFRCCLCHALGVEVHHIIPAVDGGPDTEDNAAPLCPSCHDIYGANPVKRKFIREARDFWYELCARSVPFPAEELRAISAALQRVATKDDLARLSIQNSSYVLGQSTAGPRPWDQLQYSFSRDEFVHPLILRELLGWLSDPAATIVAIDLEIANRGNRFRGDFSVVSSDGAPRIEWRSEHGESFRYRHIATTPSGIHMLECHDCTGGSGVFGSVCLLALDHDRSLYEDRTHGLFARDRVLLKTLGSISLGDRYAGDIAYRDGLLTIGPDQGWFRRGDEARMEIPIR
jgi:HNH endonuclease